MFRATRALSAVLTFGAAACMFNHSGLLPGPEPAEDASEPPSKDASNGSEGATIEGGDEPERSLDASIDASGDEDSVPPHDGGASSSDTGTPPRDVTQPVDADAQPADSGDEAGDGPAAQADARAVCAAFPDAVDFTPPGAQTPHCYWLNANRSGWSTAVTACTAQHGHLLTLSSEIETAFVLGMVPEFGTTDRVWIAGTDGRFSGDGPGSGPFFWINGEPFVYENWYSDGNRQEPDGACQDCNGSICYCEHRVAIMSDGRWDDVYEADLFRYVCEAELP